MNMLTAGCHAHDPQVVDLSGAVYTSHGPLAGWPPRRGDHLLFHSGGHFYIGEVIKADGSKVRFLGEDKWRDTRHAELAGAVLLTKQEAS